jgi:hypothetical protein
VEGSKRSRSAGLVGSSRRIHVSIPIWACAPTTAMTGTAETPGRTAPTPARPPGAQHGAAKTRRRGAGIHPENVSGGDGVGCRLGAGRQEHGRREEEGSPARMRKSREIRHGPLLERPIGKVAPGCERGGRVLCECREEFSLRILINREA